MASDPEFQPERLLNALAARRVDFVVVGGLAVIAHGYQRNTDDLDIAYDPAQDNLDRLGEVLVELNAMPRGAEDATGFVPDGRTLRRTGILTLTTDAGSIDLLAEPSGAPPYRELRAAAEVIDLFGTPIRIASLDHLVAMKRAAGRPQDQVDLDAIRTIQRLLARQEGR